jgi:hypothetical protein
MPTLTVPRLIAATAATTVILLLTACGGDEADPYSAVDTSKSGATPSASAGGASDSAVDDSAATEVPANGAKMPGTTLAKQMAAAARDKGSVQFDMVSTGSDNLNGEGAVKGTGAKSELQIRAEIRGSKVEIVKTGSTVYLKSPTPIAGKQWLKVSPSAKDPLSAIYTTIFGGFEGASDVVKMTEYVAKMGTFRSGGEEDVEGVKTTKYVAAPPATVGTKLLPSSYQALGAEALQTAKTTVSLWVDKDGLLHRSTVVFEMKDVPSVKTLTTYHDWGKPVKVTAPPASQVATSANLTQPQPSP